MPILPLVLSFLLPCLLYVHSVWRLFNAGSRGRALLVFTPALAFGFATAWLANTVARQWRGDVSLEYSNAVTFVGPIFFFFVVAMTEFPFLSEKLSIRRQARKARKQALAAEKAAAKAAAKGLPLKVVEAPAVAQFGGAPVVKLNRAARRLLKREKRMT